LCTIKDIAYINRAITKTTSRFGPSGSSKNTNINLEKITAVIAEVIKNVFFELKFII
jgi:hypothetical protein